MKVDSFVQSSLICQSWARGWLKAVDVSGRIRHMYWPQSEPALPWVWRRWCYQAGRFAHTSAVCCPSGAKVMLPVRG
jgi:hypothetical protein